VRLTLRTLLAYLDDTLEPTQAREIGQKLADNAAAQELVDRIHRAMRKRGLGVPVGGSKGDATDPNTVAQYLSDTLSAGQVADFEKACIESDASLAELGACHQILALVLSEQITVPPTARRRMYGLVGPPASLPNRKPGKAIPIGGSRDDDPPPDDRIDASYLLGMSAMTAGERPAVKAARVAVIGLTAAALVAALVVAWPRGANEPRETVALPTPAVTPATTPTAPPPAEVTPPAAVAAETLPIPKSLEPVEPAPPTPGGTPDSTPGGKAAAADPAAPAMPPMKTPEAAPKDAPATPAKVEPPAPARTDRAVVGAWEKREPLAVLVRRAPLDGSWVRLLAAEPEVISADRLVCLPGYKAAVRLDSNVVAELWGNLPDLFIGSPVLEAAVTPALPPAGYAADLTVHAGRVYVTSRSKLPGGAAVRLRLGGVVWDVLLADDKAEVVVEVSRQLAPGTPSGVRAAAGLHVAAGSVKLSAPPAAPVELTKGDEFYWDSADGKSRPGSGGDARARADRSAYWSKFPVYPDAARAKASLAALDSLSKRLVDPNRVRASVDETLQEKGDVAPTLASVVAARVAVFDFAALADLNGLASCLSDPTRSYVRDAAVVGLRSLLAADPAAAGNFRDVLIDKVRLPEDQADEVMRLLAGLKPGERTEAATLARLGKQLVGPSLPVRELAFNTLLGYIDPADPAVKQLLGYDAGAPPEFRAGPEAAWARKINDLGKKFSEATVPDLDNPAVKKPDDLVPPAPKVPPPVKKKP
jgi:hypothetical protein